MNRPPSSIRYVGVVVLTVGCLVASALKADGQSLTVIPSCGEAGKTKVCISGSGWAEPEPVCRYTFAFDGATVAPDQPDGLFGPPLASFIVPGGAAPGDHKVKVELRLNSPDTLLQTKEVPFKVVAAQKDPFAGGVTTAGTTINIAFNPTDVCDVTPCKKIVFTQVVKNTGTKADGTTTTPKPSDLGLPGAATKDPDMTPNGFYVDYLVGEKDPYYNGDDAGMDGGTQGTQGAAPTSSTMNDAPNQPDGSFPPGIVTLRYDFETAAFCASGDNAGEFLGVVKWKWEKTKGSPAASTLISTSRSAPSQDFLDALSRWDSNHSFTLPVSKIPACN